MEFSRHVWGRPGLFPALGQVLEAVRIPVIATGRIGNAYSMATANGFAKTSSPKVE